MQLIIDRLWMYKYRYKIFSKKCLTTALIVDILCEHSRETEHQF